MCFKQYLILWLPNKINLSWVPSNSLPFLFTGIINTNHCCQKFTLLGRELPWTPQGKEVKSLSLLTGARITLQLKTPGSWFHPISWKGSQQYYELVQLLLHCFLSHVILILVWFLIRGGNFPEVFLCPLSVCLIVFERSYDENQVSDD